MYRDRTRNHWRRDRIRSSNDVSTRQLNAVHDRILELLIETHTMDSKPSSSYISKMKCDTYLSFMKHLGFQPRWEDLYKEEVIDETYLPIINRHQYALPTEHEKSNAPNTIKELKDAIKDVGGDIMYEIFVDDAPKIMAVDSKDYYLSEKTKLDRKISDQLLEELPQLLRGAARGR